MPRWESGEVARRGRLLVLLKGGGLRMNLKFHLFVSDVNQGNEEAG